MMLRLYDIEKEWTAHGSKPRMRGYISIGESVPEVMTTDWKRSKTGLIAMEASLQQNWKRGSLPEHGSEPTSNGTQLAQ